MSKAVAKKPEAIPAPSEASAIVQMIERVALNPNVDIEKLERLLAMQERIMATNARVAYTAALAAMQSTLPVIPERGGIKNAKGEIQSKYALWEDINEKILPKLAEHGFSLSFRTGLTSDGKLTVTGILAHAEGHQEETTIVLPYDSSGSKNAVQAVGSSTSYGKRYTASALLNITSRGEDDDGKKGGGDGPINEEQVATIQKLIIQAAPQGSTNAIEIFLKWAKLDRIEDLAASKFDKAVAQLNAKISKKGKA